MQLNSEVLPAPFGPTRPKIWPGSTAKLTSCSTLMPPNCRLTSCRVSPAAIDCLSRRCRVASVCGLTAREERTNLIRDCQRFWCEFCRNAAPRPPPRPCRGSPPVHDRPTRGRLKGEPPRPISPAVAGGADAADTREGRLGDAAGGFGHVNVSIRRTGEVETDDVAAPRQRAASAGPEGGSHRRYTAPARTASSPRNESTAGCAVHDEDAAPAATTSGGTSSCPMLEPCVIRPTEAPAAGVPAVRAATPLNSDEGTSPARKENSATAAIRTPSGRAPSCPAHTVRAMHRLPTTTSRQRATPRCRR